MIKMLKLVTCSSDPLPDYVFSSHHSPCFWNIGINILPSSPHLPYLFFCWKPSLYSMCQSRSNTRFQYLSSCSHVYIVVWKRWFKLSEFCLCVWCFSVAQWKLLLDHLILAFPTEYINSATFSILLLSVLKCFFLCQIFIIENRSVFLIGNQ